MATQGLLSIVENNRVQLKVITGFNGQFMPELKQWLEDHPSATAKEIYDQCVNHHLTDTLVIQVGENEFLTYNEAYQAELNNHPLYTAHFHDPAFNPRWSKGEADYAEIVYR